MNDREKNIIETLREGNRELRAECRVIQEKLQSANESYANLYIELLDEKKTAVHLRTVLADLYNACMQADEEGELYYTIDGDLLDAARDAIGKPEEGQKA